MKKLTLIFIFLFILTGSSAGDPFRNPSPSFMEYNYKDAVKTLELKGLFFVKNKKIAVIESADGKPFILSPQEKMNLKIGELTYSFQVKKIDTTCVNLKGGNRKLYKIKIN